MLGPYLLGNRGPGAWVGSGGEGDPGFPEPPIVTDVNGDVTINGKVKPGSFGKFVYPLATIAANRRYTFRAVANFSQLAKQGNLAMVGFGFKNGNDFHITGLRGDGAGGTKEYIVHGTPPNGWNKQTGHTEVDNGAAAAGTQHSAYYRLTTSADGASYTLETDTDGTSYATVVTGQALTPFSNISGVTTFGVALWFNNTDAGPFTIQITEFADEEAVVLWEPDQLGAALAAWYSTITGSEGDRVASWADASGNARHATVTGDSRPTVRAADLNGLNVVEFDAITTGADYLDVPNFMSAFTAGTCIFVSKNDLDAPGTADSSGPPIKTGTSASSDHYPFTDGSIYFGYGSDARKTVGNITTSLASWGIGCFRSAANDWKYFHNGVQEFTTATNTVAFTTAPIIGAYNAGTGPWFDGRIAEIVLTNTAVSSTDREKLEGYLAHKYGLASVLDAGHPYKASAPTV